MPSKSKSSKPIVFTMSRRMSLYAYLLNPPVDFNNWTIRDVCERASKDLKFPIHPRNLTSVLEHSDLNIKLRKGNGGHSPMTVVHDHIAIVADAYVRLCRMIEVVPDPRVIEIAEGRDIADDNSDNNDDTQK